MHMERDVGASVFMFLRVALNPECLSVRTHLGVVLLKKIRGLGNHLKVAVSCLCPRFSLISFDCTQKAIKGTVLWADVMGEICTVSLFSIFVIRSYGLYFSDN